MKIIKLLPPGTIAKLLRSCHCFFTALTGVSIGVVRAASSLFKQMQADAPFGGVAKILVGNLLELRKFLSLHLNTMIAGLEVTFVLAHPRGWDRATNLCRRGHAHQESNDGCFKHVQFYAGTVGERRCVSHSVTGKVSTLDFSPPSRASCSCSALTADSLPSLYQSIRS